MKIIINADDLGMSREVNDAIFTLMAKGRITSATVLANGAAVEDAVIRAQEFPRCSFGVHLNATECQPLTRDPGLSPLLGSDGGFVRNRLREISVTSATRDAIVREWLAQVNRLRALGLSVSHLDSHHHVHTAPGVFAALKQLQTISGIHHVRISMNIYSNRLKPSVTLRVKKALWNSALRHRPATRTTGGFSSLQIFMEAVRDGKPPSGRKSVELMVHPGSADFAGETSLLATEWWRELPFPVEFISYHEI